MYASRQYQVLGDIEFALGLFAMQEDQQVARYLQFMLETTDIQYLDIDERLKRSDNEVRTALKNLLVDQCLNNNETM